MRFHLSLMALLFLACQPKSDFSRLKHDAGQYVLSSEGWLWQDITTQEFENVYLPSNGWSSAEDFLPETHPATARLDSLLATIHQRIQERYPEQLRKVPVPRARIYKDENPEAFVTAVPVCYSIPIQLEGPGAVQGPGQKLPWINLDLNGMLSSSPDDDVCIQKSMTDEEVRNYFDWINRNIKRAGSHLGQKEDVCAFRLESSARNLTIVPGSACPRAAELSSVNGSQGFVVWKTQPYLIFYTGMLQHVNAEIKLITTLAHELGHYYRNHLNSFDGDYDYFYKIDPDANPAHKPEPDLSLLERGREIRAAAHLVQSYLNEEPGQTYASEFFFPIYDLASRACPGSSAAACPKACRSFVTFLHDDEVYASFREWPYESMPEEGHLSYQQYEKGLKACSGLLTFTDEATHGDRLSLQDLGVIFAEHHVSGILKELGIKSLGEFRNQTLAQLIDRLEQGLPRARTRAREIINQAIADNIGFYTMEQEADEQQMETVSLLGLDPVQLVAWDIEFYKNYGSEYGDNDGFDMKRCGELFGRNWIENGKPVVVPTANYQDVHHSDCYRIFTTSREIPAHRWDQIQADVTIQFLSDSAWKILQDSLNSFSKP